MKSFAAAGAIVIAATASLAAAETIDSAFNETARAMADKHARSFRCGVDKSDGFADEAANDKAP